MLQKRMAEKVLFTCIISSYQNMCIQSLYMNQREKRDTDIHQPRMYKDQLEICCELQMVAHCFFFTKKVI